MNLNFCMATLTCINLSTPKKEVVGSRKKLERLRRISFSVTSVKEFLDNVARFRSDR